MKSFIFGCVTLLAILVPNSHVALAHQPHYIGTENVIAIPDALTSRAYYAELTGEPAVYTISSDKEFTLYLNILSPYLPTARKDFSATITNSRNVTIATLRAPISEWDMWSEEFAGDTYWKGPEFRETVPGDTYTITLSNPDNEGKYVLAPGEAEIFTLAGTPNTIKEIYEVKTQFFEKSWLSIFEGVIGKFLLGVPFIVLVLLTLIGRFIYRRTRRS